MERINLTTIEEIKKAVDKGKTVYADTGFYTVIKGKYGEYFIKANNGYIIGLHGQVGTKYENVLNAVNFWYIS
jgi:hypothetical protein